MDGGPRAVELDLALVVDCSREGIPQLLQTLGRLSNGSKSRPDLLFCQFRPSQFPRRFIDLPEGLTQFSYDHPWVKLTFSSPKGGLPRKWRVARTTLAKLESAWVELTSGMQGPSDAEIAYSMAKKVPLTLVACHWGGRTNRARHRAMEQATAHWMRQSHLPDEILFLELVCPGEEADYSQETLPAGFRYVQIQGNISNRGLFQKECLWNVAAKMAKNDRLMFLDYDIGPTSDVDWFLKTHQGLDRRLFLQPFSEVAYLTEDGRGVDKSFGSFAGMVEGGEWSPAWKATGGAFALRRSLWEQIGGFNQVSYEGGGDALFLWEISDRRFGGQLGKSSLRRLLARPGTRAKVQELANLTDRPTMGQVDVPIVHFWHGSTQERSYQLRDQLCMATFPLDEWLQVDDQGLLSRRSWSPLVQALCDRAALRNSVEVAANILRCGELGVDLKGWCEWVHPLLYRASDSNPPCDVQLLQRNAKRFGMDRLSSPPVVEDLTLVTVHFASEADEARKRSTLNAMWHWMAQSHLPARILFLELGFDGRFTFCQSDFPSMVEYVRMEGRPENQFLFQKECLWNVAAKMADTAKLLFLDSDLSPMANCDWFGQISRKLDHCLFLQPMSRVEYTEPDGTISQTKDSYTHLLSTGGRPNWKVGVPGGCHAMRTDAFLAMGGFSHRAFLSGGDNLAIREILGPVEEPSLLMQSLARPKVQSDLKSLADRLHLDGVCGDLDQPCAHFNHRSLHLRHPAYPQRALLMAMSIGQDPRWVDLDERGLLRWNTTDNPARILMQNYQAGRLSASTPMNEMVDGTMDLGRYSGEYHGLQRRLEKSHGPKGAVESLIELNAKFPVGKEKVGK